MPQVGPFDYGRKIQTETLPATLDYASYRQGLAILLRMAPVGRAHTSAAPSHEYYCSNNDKRLRNLQKLENNNLFSVAYSNVIILYPGVQIP
jgi:hypothetical protein